MTVKHFIVSEDGRILHLIKGEKKKGNPYRDAAGRFATRKRIKKSTQIYFIDQENGNIMTKDEYDDRIAKMILENKEEVEIHDDDIVQVTRP